MKYGCSVLINLNIRSSSLPLLLNKLMAWKLLQVTCTPCLCMFYTKHTQSSSTVTIKKELLWDAFSRVCWGWWKCKQCWLVVEVIGKRWSGSETWLVRGANSRDGLSLQVTTSSKAFASGNGLDTSVGASVVYSGVRVGISMTVWSKSSPKTSEGMVVSRFSFRWGTSVGWKSPYPGAVVDTLRKPSSWRLSSSCLLFLDPFLPLPFLLPLPFPLEPLSLFFLFFLPFLSFLEWSCCSPGWSLWKSSDDSWDFFHEKGNSRWRQQKQIFMQR